MSETKMDDMLLINVVIFNRKVALRIERSKELIYREAVKALNERIEYYQKLYPQLDLVGVILSAAYDISVQYVSRGVQLQEVPLASVVDALAQEIDDLIE